MTSIATSLQTDTARNLPIVASDSSYINIKSRESSKLSNGAACKSNNVPPTLMSDGKSINNTSAKTLGSKYRTMSTSPTTSFVETSDLSLSASSHLMGYLPQYEAISRNAQYLGSFPVQAADQGDRAEFVRKQLVSMKEVTPKRPVLMVISLAGIKVCCPQGQTIYSSHALRRISYATCEPSNKLIAFLAREPHSPLYLQHCHVFRTSNAEQAEDLNTLVGNAFRVAYAVQIQSDMDEQQQLSHLTQEQQFSSPPSGSNLGFQNSSQDCYMISSKTQSELQSMASNHTNNNHVPNSTTKKGPFTQSRSVESLLSSNVNQCRSNSPHFLQNDYNLDDDIPDNIDDGCYANLDEIRYINNTNGVFNTELMATNGNDERIERVPEEPFYETADFVRASRERMSDNTFSRKATTQFVHADRNYPGRFSQRSIAEPKKNIRYPPPKERAPAVPSSEMQHSRTMHSLAHKSCNPATEQRMSNNLVHQLTLHQQHRYQSEGIQHLPLNESISQKVAAAIAQGNRANCNFDIPLNSQRPPINGSTSKKSRPEKPNSLPVLNCLFAALNKQHKQKDNEDDNTPYCEVPDSTFSQLLSHPLSDKFHSTLENHNIPYNNTVFKQNGKSLQVSSGDDFNHQNIGCDINSQNSTPPSQPSTNTSGFISGQGQTSGSGSGGSGMSGSATYYINESMSESSGDSLNNSNTGSNNAARALQQLRNTRNNIERDNGQKLKGNQMKGSKSAHVITSCEVYAEVADAAGVLHSSDISATNHKRQSYHSGGNAVSINPSTSNTSRFRKPLNLSIDELRNVNGNSSSELLSPSAKDKNKLYINGGGNSSGFNSGGDGSTCSNGTTPPPLGRSTPNVSSINGLTQGSTVATISNINFDALNDCSILDEPELQTVPWFQSGMPRDLALEVLKREPEGAFLVRESNSRSGRLALSVRVPLHFHASGIAHYLIVRAPKGFRIKGCPKQFATMTSLIVHHSVMAEMLPCTLSLSRYNPTFRPSEEKNNSDGNDDSDDNDGDYLDPSKDSDYELISKLRFDLMKRNSPCMDDDNYSELQSIDYESTSNNKCLEISVASQNATVSPILIGNHNITKENTSSRENSTTSGRQQYR